MNYSTILIPRHGDNIVFEKYELKIRHIPNLTVMSSGATVGFSFEFRFLHSDLVTDIPLFEKDFQYHIDQSYDDTVPLKYSGVSKKVANIDSVIYMYEPHIIGPTYNIHVEGLEVYGKLDIRVDTNNEFIVIFRGGILELPSIEKLHGVSFERKLPAKNVKPKTKIPKEYNRFETLDLS